MLLLKQIFNAFPKLFSLVNKKPLVFAFNFPALGGGLERAGKQIKTAFLPHQRKGWPYR
jgi:hypothetical protein